MFKYRFLVWKLWIMLEIKRFLILNDRFNNGKRSKIQWIIRLISFIITIIIWWKYELLKLNINISLIV